MGRSSFCLNLLLARKERSILAEELKSELQLVEFFASGVKFLQEALWIKKEKVARGRKILQVASHKFSLSKPDFQVLKTGRSNGLWHKQNVFSSLVRHG